MRTPSVLLVNGWSDDNKGDAAIVHGMLQSLQSACPGVRLALISTFAAREPRFRSHHRLTAALFPDLRIEGSLLAPKLDRPWGRFGAIARLGWLARSLALLAVAPIVRRWPGAARVDSRLAAYLAHDLVVSKGGHILFSSGGLRGLVGLYLNLFPILLGIRLGRPTAIFAHSIGPVHGRASRWLVRWALRRCALVATREELSLGLTRSLLGPGHERTARLTRDTAFALTPAALPDEVTELLPRRFVVLTVRQWHFPYLTSREEAARRYREYLRTLAEVVRVVNREHGLPVVLAPQVVGPTPAEDDRVAWAELLALCGRETRLLELRADLSPAQLVELYRRAELVVGTRFHSVILALAAGTPAVAIAYHGFKAEGIMQGLRLDEYVFQIDRLSAHELCDGIRRALTARAELKSRIAEEVAEIRRALDADVRALLALADRRDPAPRPVVESRLEDRRSRNSVATTDALEARGS
ncbi:MAG TPA: polysaccharide pyruvyl transferase family protein [Gemmatimonadales bacterium]|nr:polysaccharide pyruvyl transferase family protein [Gemmatimonadales bacterium]